MNNNNQTPKKNNKNFFSTFLISVLCGFAIFGYIFGSSAFFNKKVDKLTYYQMVELIDKEAKNKDTKIAIKEMSEGQVLLTIGDGKEAKTYESKVNPRESGMKDIISKHNIDYEFVVPTNFLGNLFNFLIFGIFVAVLWYSLSPMLKMKKMTGKQSTQVKNIPLTTFDDIGGLSEEVKREILQVVERKKNPELAKKLDLKASKGILLHGPSGTGKTLIAKAIAHSFKANFIAAEGSSFVEMFAGLGAKRARELFENARKNSPTVIFIDEIDAIGKKRSNGGFYGGNDEREQTLNQILVAMDGIEDSSDVFVVAATNRVDVLDEALLRPGRFDYKIMVDLPDLEGRKEIINIHTKKKPLSEDVRNRIDEIARSTAGFSGADIENVFMNAGYNAYNNQRENITMDDVNYGLDRIMLGNEGRKTLNEDTRKRVAYHEAGHAVVSILTTPGSVRKATIVPRGQALGFVAQLPKEGLYSEDELMDRLKVMVAGGVAETLVFPKHSAGVSDDFKKAKELIEKMVEDWGMGGTPLIPTFSKEEKEDRMRTVYEKVINETTSLLRDNFEYFERTALLLLEKETVDGKEIEDLRIIENTQLENDTQKELL